MRAARESADIQREGESPGCPPAHHLPRGVPLGRRKHCHRITECHHAMRAPYSPSLRMRTLEYLLYFDTSFGATLRRCALVTWSTKRVEPELGRPAKSVTLILCVPCGYREPKITGTQEHFLAYRAPAQPAGGALTMSRVEKHGIIFDEQHSPESAYVLLSGVARITCRNRKGDRALVIMVAPGMIPGFLRRSQGSAITSAARRLPTARSERSRWRPSLKSRWGSPRPTSSAWPPAIPDAGTWCNCAAQIS